jgi:C4-dicarboxylate-specific signal transduction histidine kinase
MMPLLSVEPDTSCEWVRPVGIAGDCRSRLLSGYLHKTSNSLCGIKGYASMIARGPGAAARPEAWARKIIAEVEKLENIYRSIQEMAFPQLAEPGDAKLDHVLRDALAAATKRHANLRATVPAPLAARLLLPERDLELVFAEVLANAAESRTGLVHVRVETGITARGRYFVRLADDGPGMAAELLMQAPDPFVTTRPGHLGIGLARVDTIMDIYGLGWGLRSSSGTGTVVTLEIGETAAGDEVLDIAKGRT